MNKLMSYEDLQKLCIERGSQLFEARLENDNLKRQLASLYETQLPILKDSHPEAYKAIKAFVDQHKESDNG